MGEIYAFEHKNYAPTFTVSYAGKNINSNSIDAVDLLKGDVVYDNNLETSFPPAC